MRSSFDIITDNLLHLHCHDSATLGEVPVVVLNVEVRGFRLVLVILTSSGSPFLVLVRALVMANVARVVISCRVRLEDH